MADVITAEQLYVFYSMEQRILSKLIDDYECDPIRAVLTVAFWLWLRYYNDRNHIHKIVHLEPGEFKTLAKEAHLCLRCLEHSDANNIASYSTAIPFTARLIQQDITLAILNYWRFTTIADIEILLNNVCNIIFTDMLSCVYGMGPTSISGPPTPMTVPNFPHAIYGPFRPDRLQCELGDERLWHGRRWWELPIFDAVFLTSAANLREENVWHLFGTLSLEKNVIQISIGSFLGEEQPAPREEAMYATVVVDSVATVDHLLKGKRVKHFKLNSKDICARKYEHTRRV